MYLKKNQKYVLFIGHCVRILEYFGGIGVKCELKIEMHLEQALGHFP